MTTRLAGYQPQYFPRLHYMARVLNSDIFSLSDYVQYVRKHAYPQPDGSMKRGPSFQAHTPINSAQGTLLLDIPVRHAELEPLNTVPVDYSVTWYKKHLKTIAWNYQKASQFKILFPELEILLSKQYNSLADLTTATIVWSLAVLLELPDRMEQCSVEWINAHLPHEPFRLKTIVQLSKTSVAPPDKSIGRDANEWILDTCQQLGANEYHFGGTSAAAYADYDRLVEANIALLQQDWRCTPYTQQSEDFVANLSILDLLLNVSPQEARAILATPEQQ